MQALKLADGNYPDLIEGHIYDIRRITSTHVFLEESKRPYCHSSFIFILDGLPIPAKRAYAIYKQRSKSSAPRGGR